jgi:hypothetical protein
VRLGRQPGVKRAQRRGRLVPARQILDQAPPALAGDVGQDVVGEVREIV